MNAHRCVLLSCALALTTFAASCEMPRARAPVPETGPAIADDAYVDPAKPFLNLERERLRVVWQQSLAQLAKNQNLRNVYLAGDVIVAETGDANLFLFSADTGVWQASTSLKSVLRHAPVLATNGLFALTGRGIVMINPKTGRVERELPSMTTTTAPPVPFGTTLILGGGTGAVLRVSDETGLEVWRANVDGMVADPPQTDAANVYALGRGGSIVATTGRDGRMMWKWRPLHPSKLVTGLTLGDRKLFFGDNRGFVYAQTADEGIVLWKLPVGSPAISAPVYNEGRVFVGTRADEMVCIRQDVEPSVLWVFTGANRLVATGEDYYYLLTSDHSIAALAKDTGVMQWRRPLRKDTVVISDPIKSRMFLFRPNGALMALDEVPRPIIPTTAETAPAGSAVPAVEESK